MMPRVRKETKLMKICILFGNRNPFSNEPRREKNSTAMDLLSVEMGEGILDPQKYLL